MKKDIKRLAGRIGTVIYRIRRAREPQEVGVKKKSLWRLWWIAATVGIVALVTMLALLTLTPAPTPDVTPVPPEIEKGLLILSHTTYIDKYGYFHLIGEVENLGECGTEHNRVRADFYDDQGMIYSTGTGECFRKLIGPDGKSPFEIVLSEGPETLTYKLTTLSQPAENLPAGGFSFSEVFLESGVDSEYIVKGMIHNDSNDDIETALILGTFYDNDGNVTAVGFTFPDIIPIQPGGSSEFIMMVDSHGNPIVSFALHAETSP